MPAQDVITGILPGAEAFTAFDRMAAVQRKISQPARPDGSAYGRLPFFHRPEWENVLMETYGYTPMHLVSDEVGFMPSRLHLMEIRSWLTGRRGISLPFTDHCEPLVSNSSSFRKLFQRAIELGRSRGWNFVEVRGGRKFLGAIPASLSFHGHTLDLTGDENDLFNRLEGSVRRAIRKARKENVAIEIATDLNALRTFYSLHCQTRRRYGLPPQPFSFFHNLHRRVLSRDGGAVVLGFHKNQPVAAAVHFRSDDEAIYKFGASDERSQPVRANNLVMWEAIRWHRQNGATKLDLGRTSIGQEGLRRFKSNWNATEHKIEYFRFDLRRNCFVTVHDQAAGWHAGIFRRLPALASRLAGNVLYRHCA